MAAAKTSSPKTAPHWRPDLIGGDQPAAVLVAACNELKFEAKGGRPTFKKSSSRSTWHPLGVPGLTANVGTVIVLGFAPAYPMAGCHGLWAGFQVPTRADGGGPD